jgi:hypothetical protein
MAVISVPSSATGATYSVRIAGDTPTAAEQARIDAYVAQMDSSMAPAAPTAPQEEQSGGLGSAFGVGVDILQQGYGSAVEGFGASTGLDFLRDYGARVAEENKQQVAEATPGLTGYEDVDDIGSALSFYGQTLAQQVPQLGVSLAGGYGGAKLGGALGSIVPGVGTAVGAAIGGVGGSILANIPYFYGDNRERQKEVIEETGSNAEVSEGAAFLTSLPQAALDGLVDRLLIGKIISPSWISRGGVFTRAVKGTGAGAAVEVPTEIGQQVLNRLQAGLPIDDDEALEEYKQVAITAGIVGGTVRGATNVVGGDIAKVEKAKADEQALRDLEEDQKEEAEDATKRIAFGDAATAPPPAPPAPQAPAPAALQLQDLRGAQPPAPTQRRFTGPITDSEYRSLSDADKDIYLDEIGLPPPPKGTAGAAPAVQPAGLSIKGIDDAISNGVASLTVEEDGKQVPFNKFAISVDGDKAEVGFVERAKSARKGVGYDAYVKLGTELAGRGITLQASSTKYAPGRELWNKLEKNGYAKLNPANNKVEFVAPAKPAAAGTAPTQESLVTPDTPRPPQPFRWRDYTAATQAVVNAKDASVPAIQKAASADPKKPAPPAVAKAIRDRMVADGVIVADKKSKGGFRVVPTRVPDVDQTESYRRTLDDLQQDAQDATAAQQKALLDARRAEQTGSKADARKFNLQADAAAETLTRIQATRQEVEARLPRATAETAVPRTEAPLSPVAEGRAAVPITEAPAAAQTTAVSDRAKRLKQSLDYYQQEAARKAAEARRLRESGKKVQLPNSDRQRIVELERDAAADVRMAQGIRAALARPASDIEQDRAQKTAAAAKEASVAAEAAARAPIYTAKEGQLFTALRRRLDNLGLSDVKLIAERVIRPSNAPENSLVEGMMEVDRRNGNRIIALALGVYDPKMTQQELFDAISGVMNHEVIHAIRSLGLFTDGEWKTLSDLAARQRYMKVKDGKSVERGYTYLQRAQQMYADSTPEIQSEEAVAEMFRDYVAGRLKVGGKPKTLMDRIKGFFKALWGAHAETGLTDPNAIFEGVRFGDIGRRERKAEAAPDGDARLSRLIATDNPGGEWLKNKQRRAEQDMRTADPGSSSGKGITGSTTAYMPKPVNMPVDILSSLTGANDEVRRPGDARYDELAADVARRGFVPDQDGNAVVVGVNHLGQAYLKEGNTRVAVARDFGVPSVRAEVRWFNGGELADGPFSPAAVERLATEGGRDDVGRNESKDVRESRRLEAAIAASATGSPLEVAAQKYVARATAGNPEFGQLTPLDLDNITEEFFDRPGWAVITATDNTREGPFKESQNARAHEQLRADMEYAGIPYRIVEGMYKGEPDGISYMILADEPTARKLGMRYNQESILTSRGWVYAKRTLPRTIRTEGVYYGDEARQQDFFTDLGDGGAFSLNLDTEGSGPENPDIGPGFYTEDNRPQLPIRASDGLVELHHWSDKQLDVIDPAFAGTGPLKGDERGRGAKLAFFGINPRGDDLVQGTGYVKEPGLGNFEHIALVKPETLYPWELDPDGLATDLDKTSRKGTSEYERRIRDAGYKGYYTERVSPDTAPLGNVAALFDKVPVKPAREVKLALRNPPRYSMISGIKKPLTKSERKLTVLDRMDPVTAEFFSDGKTRSVMEALIDLNNPRKNVVIMPGDPDSVKTLARLMLAELRMALIRSPEAIGWYGTTLAKAKKVAALLHPEISPVNPYSGAKSNIYDPNAEHAWDLAMAITSNGMAVSENAKFANVQYEHWKETGQFLEEGTGDQGTGMVAAFRAYNTMKRTMTDDQIAEFLSRKMTVRDLRNNPILKDIGVKVGSSESADAVINGSFIFGPKIGQGFYQNLRGNFDPLTMDLWFMRMFNRLTGRPFFEAKEKTLLENAERVASEANSNALSDYDKRVKRIAMESENIDIVTPENADRFAVAFDKIYQRDFKKFYDVAVAESGLSPKSREAKAIGKAARPLGSQLVLSSKRYRENLEISPQDAPRGPKDRAYMRAVVDQVKAALASDGIEISTADIQAVMWYAEKQLFASMGVRQGKGGDNDYVDGAIELLRSKGIEDDEIARTLPAAERDRLRYRTAAERTAARVRGEPEPDVQGGRGAQDVPGATLGGGPSAAQGDGDQGGVDQRLSIRYAISPSTAAIRRNIQSNQKDLMYARSSDVLAGLISKTRLVDEKAARRFTDGVLRRFQDSMIPIGRMVQELSSRGMTIVDAMDPYLQEMLMHGVVGNKITSNQKGLYEPVANAIKRINVPQAKIDQLITASNVASKDGKGYVSLAMKQGDSPRMVLADAYLYARHAVERNRYIKANKDKTNDSGSGMTDAEANAILQWFKSLDANNTQALADIAKGIRLIVADTNHNRVDGGLIATDTDDPYNFYVPLRGITDTDSNAEEDSFSGQAPTRSLGARGREDRRALGRSGYAADLVANVFSQNQNAILRSERNKVGQSLLRLLRADPAKTKDFAEVLPFAPKTRTQLSGARLSEGRDPSAYDEPDILVVKENGKEVFVRFEDPIVAGAMNGKNGFSPGSSSALLNAMQRVNSYLATINTSYNPEFVISNMARDLTTAGVNINQFEMDGLTSDALKNLKSALVGLKRSIINKDDSSEWAKIYKDFAAAGGQNVTNQVSTLADQMANIQSILGDISDSGMRGKWNSVKNGFVGKGVGSILNTMENINTVVENGIRVATYKAMIDRGVSKQRAAQAARNITVNFAKGGDYRQFMGAWSLFYNASIQGSFALINAATRSKRVQKIWIGAMAAGFLMDQLNSLLSDEDDEGLKAYDQLEDYVLEHNFVIIDPLGISERGYITIPMPYGLNVLYNAGRSISAVGRGKDTAGEATSNIFRTFVDSFNPIGGYDSFYKLAAPTIADPFVELSENKDFAGRNIYKEALPFDKTPAPDSQMYWTTTSPSAVWISNTLNSITGGNEVRPGLVDVSPNVLEYWFDLVTGGVGKFVQRTVESPLAIAEEGFTEEVIRDIPLLRKVVGSVSSREDMGTYIDGAKAILTAGEELKRAREVGDAAWARQTIQRYEKELRLVGPIKSFESALRETAKMRNQINANPNIPDEQRKVLLDRIEERRQMILKRANALIRGAGL